MRRVRLDRQRHIRRGPQYKRDDLALAQHDLRPDAPALMSLVVKIEVLELHLGVADVVMDVLGDVAEVELEAGLGGVKHGLEVRGDGRVGGLGLGRGDGGVDLEGGRVRGAGVVEGGGALDADGHGAADDFDAAYEPWEERASGGAARLTRKVVWNEEV